MRVAIGILGSVIGSSQQIKDELIGGLNSFTRFFVGWLNNTLIAYFLNVHDSTLQNLALNKLKLVTLRSTTQKFDPRLLC